MKDQLAPAGCGVDVLLQALEAHPPLSKRCDGVDEVPERAAKAIQPPDDYSGTLDYDVYTVSSTGTEMGLQPITNDLDISFSPDWQSLP